jgi:hypothetical protein
VKLNDESVALLVQKAFVFEPLADKPDCTTRYTDLPGRPLESFILSGINIGPVFRRFAKDHLSQDEHRLFHYFVEALKEGSKHTSGKYVNFGLLEIMFPTVAARLVCDDPEMIVATIIELVKKAPLSDAKEMVYARELAWSTSEKREAKMAALTPEVRLAANPYDFYEKISVGTPHGSITQWVANYQQGLPLLAEQFDTMRYRSGGSLLERIREAYVAVQNKNPDVRAGILADMSAAAVFLYLSFTEVD